MKIRSIFNRSSDLDSGNNNSVEDPVSRKKPKGYFVETVQRTVSEYTRRSTIHGISYIGDNDRNPFERLWWFITLVCSVCGAYYLIYQAYEKMTDNPIIESPSLNPAPMWDVPFPAITVCPSPNLELTPFGMNKTNWPEFVQNFLPDDLSVTLPYILDLLLERSHQDNYYDIAKKALPEIDISEAMWIRDLDGIDVTLDKTITGVGACRTFNMFHEKDIMRDGVILSSHGNVNDKKKPLWSRDFGFQEGLPLENYTYPFRSFDKHQTFMLWFNVNESERLLKYSFRNEILIHAPDEFPIFTKRSNFITVKDAVRDTLVEITPHLVVSKGIENYKPSVRRCFYATERHLKYYKFYTQNHCELECITNGTLEDCGCVPYHLPHFNDTKLCEHRRDCHVNASVKLYTRKFVGEKNYLRGPIDDCDCLPTCNQLTYSVQVMSINEPGENSFTFQFKSPLFKKDIRSELHSLNEFLSISGGSLGLFLGVSIFSIFELLYFCTVRLCFHGKRIDRGKDSGKSNERLHKKRNKKCFQLGGSIQPVRGSIPINVTFPNTGNRHLISSNMSQTIQFHQKTRWKLNSARVRSRNQKLVEPPSQVLDYVANNSVPSKNPWEVAQY